MRLVQPPWSRDFDIRRLSSPGSDRLFPSRAVNLPDELRGALLLPSEDEDFSSTNQSWETDQAKGVSSSNKAGEKFLQSNQSWEKFLQSNHSWKSNQSWEKFLQSNLSWESNQAKGVSPAENSCREPALMPSSQVRNSSSPALDPSLRPASLLGIGRSGSYSPSLSPTVDLPADLVDLEEEQAHDSVTQAEEQQGLQDFLPDRTRASSRSTVWSLSDADLQDLLAQAEDQGLVDRPESQALSDGSSPTPNDFWESGMRWSSLSELCCDRGPDKEKSQSPFLRTESPASLARSIGICI